MKFSKGQNVRVILINAGAPYYTLGKIGKIVKIFGLAYKVEFNLDNNQKESWMYHEDELILSSL